MESKTNDEKDKRIAELEAKLAQSEQVSVILVFDIQQNRLGELKEKDAVNPPVSKQKVQNVKTQESPKQQVRERVISEKEKEKAEQKKLNSQRRIDELEKERKKANRNIDKKIKANQRLIDGPESLQPKTEPSKTTHERRQLSSFAQRAYELRQLEKIKRHTQDDADSSNASLNSS